MNAEEGGGPRDPADRHGDAGRGRDGVGGDRDRGSGEAGGRGGSGDPGPHGERIGPDAPGGSGDPGPRGEAGERGGAGDPAGPRPPGEHGRSGGSGGSEEFDEFGGRQGYGGGGPRPRPRPRTRPAEGPSVEGPTADPASQGGTPAGPVPARGAAPHAGPRPRPGSSPAGPAHPEARSLPSPGQTRPAGTRVGGSAPGEARSAFTPPEGIPVVLPPEGALWQDRMRAMIRMPSIERPAPPGHRLETEGAAAVSVPRVLDLTLRIGELLLAGGEGAEDVEAAMFGVAFAYGLARIEPTVTFTLLGISYQPALTEPPVTMSRTVRRRGTDYTRLAAVFHLVDGITAHEVTLEEAYRRLADIRRNRHPYGTWVLTAAGGLLAGAGGVLVGGGPVIFAAAALAAMLGDRLAWLLAGRGLPEFYQFAVAAMPAAAMGVFVDRYAHWIPGAVGVQSSAVITGGLFALLPGRALVAAVQDGLTGFYITASARLLEVMYLVVGLVVGVTLVLYAGARLGANLDFDQALRVHDVRPWVQLPAAMVLTLAFAVLLQCERGVLLPATLNGGVAWTIFGVLHQRAGGNQVAATAAAAGLVGLFGQLMARYRYVSVLPYVTAAIGPLLPGSATYFGLLALTQHHPSAALTQLTKAAALALALAIGVNLGNEIARLALKPPGPSAPRRAAKRTRGF